MANLCPVCGGKMGLLNRERSADGLICASCMNFFYSKVGFQASKFSTKELADFWAVHEKRRKQFKETDSMHFMFPWTTKTNSFILVVEAGTKALA